MPTAKKEATVAELKDLVARANIVIGADYRGLTVKEMTALRRVLRESGTEARVVKNKLFKIAAEQAGVSEASAIVDGPTLVIFGYGDIVAPAKAVSDYARTARNAFAPRRAFLDGGILDSAAIADLASLPSREQLIARLAGALISPLQNLANLLSASLRDTAGLLEARAAQMEGEAA
jgi:large subunit ribosomal protein L10